MAFTWNPDDKHDSIELLDGNLVAKHVSEGHASGTVRATSGASSGKWYWEIQHIHGDCTDCCFTQFGIALASHALHRPVGYSAESYCYRNYFDSSYGGYKAHDSNEEEYGTTLADGDIVMIALDLDNGKIWWGKNGTWFEGGDPATGANPAYTGISGYFYPAISFDRYGTRAKARFWKNHLSFTPPAGFRPWEGGIYVVSFDEGAEVSDAYDAKRGYTLEIEEQASVEDKPHVASPNYMTIAEEALVSERYDVPSPIYTEVTELSSVEDVYTAANLTTAVTEAAGVEDGYIVSPKFGAEADQGLVQDHWEISVFKKFLPTDSYIGHVGSSPTVDITKAPITGDATISVVADAAGLGGAVLSEGIEVSCEATASQVIVAQGIASATLGVEALGAGFAEASAEVDVDATGCVSTLGSAIAELLLSVSGEASAEIRGQGDASIVPHVSAAGHSSAVAEGRADVILGLSALGAIGKLATGECALQLTVEGSGAPVPTGKAEASLRLCLQAFARTNIGVCVLRYTR